MLRSLMLRITPAFTANTAALRATPAPRRTFAAGTTRPKALSKTEAIEKLAASTQVKKADVNAVVNGLLDMIQDSVKAGEKVTLTGFGTFEQRVRSARKGRNPATGKELDIPETKAPAFSAGKSFKDHVKGV